MKKILLGFFVLCAFISSITIAKNVFAEDTTAPRVESVSHDSIAKTIVYTFSEPVQLIKQADLEDDRKVTPYSPALLGIYEQGVYTAPRVVGTHISTVGNIEEATLTDNVLVVKYSGDLPEGYYIVDAWGYDITDSSKNLIDKSDPSKFFFHSDKTAPKVTSIPTLTNKAITYTFSEPVQLIRQADAVVDQVPVQYSKEKLGIYEKGVYIAEREVGEHIPKIGEITEATLTNNVLVVKYSGILPEGDYIVDAWGYDITDLSKNLIDKSDPSKFFFHVEKNIPTVISSRHYQDTKTITYTFSDEMKLIAQDNDETKRVFTPLSKELLGIYELGAYNAPRAVGIKVPTTGLITEATLTNNILVVKYSGILPEGDYIIDAWGYDITDSEKNLIPKDNKEYVFHSDKNIPTVISSSHDQAAKTITYTFTDAMKLYAQDNDETKRVLTPLSKELLGIYELGAYSAPRTVGVKVPTTGTITEAKLTDNVLVVKYSGILPEGDYVVDAWGYDITDSEKNLIKPTKNQIFHAEKTAPEVVVAPVTSSGSRGGSYVATAINNDANILAQISALREQIKLLQSAGGEVLGASTFTFTRELTVGMRGDDVVELQKVLRAEGYFTFATDTGYFGQITKAAVKAYQKAHGIIETGYVGALTIAELNK